MSFFKSIIVRFQMIVLVSSLLLITGCVSALLETPEGEMPVASDTVEDVAPQNEIGINEVAAINEMPNEILDHQALAEYQFRLSGGTFGHVEDREPTVIDAVPNQIPDHQALAEYQLRLSNTDFGRIGPHETVVTDWMPNEIPDRQALAEYQFRLSGGTLGR